jgi:hypothetical protein
MNRYTRDEVLHTALDMADVATLEVHDRPDGVILPKAHSIKWLQNMLDMFYNRYPFAGEVVKAAMLVQAHQEDVLLATPPEVIPGEIAPSLYLPHDFAIDVTDGLIIPYGESTFYRVKKIAFQPWLRVQTFYRSAQAPQARVLYYTIINNRIKTVPLIAQSVLADLWYYRLPPVLEANDIPRFPDDWTLIEYVRLRAMEWVRHPAVPIGTAKAYAEAELSADRQAGLLQRSEEDQLPLATYGTAGGDSYNEMYGFLSGWPQVAS